MSSITDLDENEIRDFTLLNTEGGIGPKVHDALAMYTSRLGKLSGDGFNDKDTSTAHEVIDELQSQMLTISGLMDDVDSMIDHLFLLIRTSILDKEDELADS